MKSYYTEGSKIQFEGFKGTVIKITETYRKNVLVVKISEYPKHKKFVKCDAALGLFEYPDGHLEFMSFID